MNRAEDKAKWRSCIPTERILQRLSRHKTIWSSLLLVLAEASGAEELADELAEELRGGARRGAPQMCCVEELAEELVEELARELRGQLHAQWPHALAVPRIADYVWI